MIFLILPVGKHVLWDRFGGIACLILRPSSVSVYSFNAQALAMFLSALCGFKNLFFFFLLAVDHLAGILQDGLRREHQCAGASGLYHNIRG
jgi:hypothetical protein